jgi:hypothetical protein
VENNMPKGIGYGISKDKKMMIQNEIKNISKNYDAKKTQTNLVTKKPTTQISQAKIVQSQKQTPQNNPVVKKPTSQMKQARIDSKRVSAVAKTIEKKPSKAIMVAGSTRGAVKLPASPKVIKPKMF